MKKITITIAAFCQLIPAAYAVAGGTSQPQPAEQQQQGHAQGQGQAQQAVSGAAAGAASDAQSVSAARANTSTNVGVGVTTGPTTVTTGGSKSSSGASVGPVLTSAKTGDSTSTSSALGGNGGTGTGGDSSLTGSGNGGGGTGTASTGPISTTNNSSTKILDFFPVDVAPLPPTMGVGGIRLKKTGSCGPLVIVKPFVRTTRMPQLFGLWNTKVPVQTMHGTFEGFNAKQQFVTVTIDLPPPFNKRIIKLYGHQLYLTVEEDVQGGGSSSAANYAAQKMVGAGASLSANSAYGVIGVVAVPCEMRVEEATIVSPPAASPTIGLNAPKTEVLATTGKHVLVKESTKPLFCNGKPIPEGFRCAFVRDKVAVVKDVDLTK